MLNLQPRIEQRNAGNLMKALSSFIMAAIESLSKFFFLLLLNKQNRIYTLLC
jgi:hypothetical protein